MKSKPHDIFSIFSLLYDFEMCNSEHEYSVEWLGRSKTYLAYLKSSKNYPCIEALVYLAVRLLDASANLVSARVSSAEPRSRAAVLNDAGATILRLACKQASALSRCHVMRSNSTPPSKLDGCTPD
jgi:hypothetical protein